MIGRTLAPGACDDKAERSRPDAESGRHGRPARASMFTCNCVLFADLATQGPETSGAVPLAPAVRVA